MAHPLTADLGQSDLDAALLTNHATMLQALVFAAEAFIVLHWAKNLGAEQAIPLGLECTVVNRLWFFDFAIRPGANLLRRCQANFDFVKNLVLLNLLE